MLFVSLVVTSLLKVGATTASNCDNITTNGTHKYYKKFCGRHFMVGFSNNFKPYSWLLQSTEDGAEKEEIERITKDEMPEYTTLDNWIGLDVAIMDEVAEFLGFNYTVTDIAEPAGMHLFESHSENWIS